MHTCIPLHILKTSWRSCPRRVNATNPPAGCCQTLACKSGEPTPGTQTTHLLDAVRHWLIDQVTQHQVNGPPTRWMLSGINLLIRWNNNRKVSKPPAGCCQVLTYKSGETTGKWATYLLDAVRHGGVNQAKKEIPERPCLLAQHLAAQSTGQGQGHVWGEQTEAQQHKVMMFSEKMVSTDPRLVFSMDSNDFLIQGI